MESIVQMPQTFFLLTQPKMETLFNSNKITANYNILTVTMKQVTKLRKSFRQNSITPNSSRFTDKFKAQLEPVLVNCNR